MKYHSAMEPSDCIYAYHIHNGTWVSFANRHTTKAITAETGTATTGHEAGREEALAHAQVVRCCDTIRNPGGSVVLYCSCRTSAATWQPANGSTVLDRRGGETVGLPGARRRSRPLLSRAAPFVREGRSALCRDGALPGLFPVRTPPAGRRSHSSNPPCLSSTSAAGGNIFSIGRQLWARSYIPVSSPRQFVWDLYRPQCIASRCRRLSGPRSRSIVDSRFLSGSALFVSFDASSLAIDSGSLAFVLDSLKDKRHHVLQSSSTTHPRETWCSERTQRPCQSGRHRCDLASPSTAAQESEGSSLGQDQEHAS